jgi:hypothetical protein
MGVFRGSRSQVYQVSTPADEASISIRLGVVMIAC